MRSRVSVARWSAPAPSWGGADPGRFVLVDRVAADQRAAVGLPEADATECVSGGVEDVEFHVACGDDVAFGERDVDAVGQDGLIEPA